MSKPFNKVFRDPIHDLIRLEDQFILDLIDTKEFQRLRRIKQLGLSHFVYPGAQHTRFEHSLGVYNFACRMLDKLRQRYLSDEDVRDELKVNSREIKTAALLHDLGHGPFSHVFERVHEDAGVGDHEQWTCKIIQDKSTDVFSVLCDSEIDVDYVLSLICDDPPGVMTPSKAPYLRDIVHGQLDADRMDYLLRDSLMTGARYGEYDSEWILNVLALGECHDGATKIRKLCLDPGKGMGAIERLLHARLLMTKYVYGHKTTRAYEAELIMTLRLAAQLVDLLPDNTPDPVRIVLAKKGDIETKDYLMLDDEVAWWAIRRWAAWDGKIDGAKSSLANSLRRHSLRLVRRQEPWKTVKLDSSKKLACATRLVNELHHNRDEPLKYECYLDKMTTWPYKDPAVSVRTGTDPEQAFFEDIHVLKDNQAVSIQEFSKSDILSALSERWGEYRFHFDRKYHKEFTGLLKEFGVC